MTKYRIIPIASAILLVLSCTTPMTKVELLSDNYYDIGQVKAESSDKYMKEWLIQNIGNASLVIDSVYLSCECLKAIYRSDKETKPNEYFPLKVLFETDVTIGDFYREVLVYCEFCNCL